MRRIHLVFLSAAWIVFANMAGGCAAPAVGRMSVIYATDRNWTGKANEYFGGGRTGPTFGQCEVGVITSDRPTPTKYEITRPALASASAVGVLRTPQRFNGKETLSAIQQALAAAPKRRILLFVHGFNVSFTDACSDAAQLAYDLNYQGTAMVFDWPSQARLFGYFADEESAQWVAPHLAHFLHQLQVAAPDANIDIVAHSMGSRVVTFALRELQCEGALDNRRAFGHVVFLAPDIDVDIFRDTVMAHIHPLSAFTVYGSSSDKALRISKWLHDHKREGERPDRFTIDDLAKHQPPWFQSVDATAVDTSGLGHSYYTGGVAQVTLDLLALLNDDDANRVACWNADHTFRVLLEKSTSASCCP